MGIVVILIIVVFVFVFLNTRKKKRQDTSRITFQISTSGYPTQQRFSVSPDSVWVTQGKSVNVAGYTIPGGLLYVGSGLFNIQGWSIEPALIDPSLPVARDSSDKEGVHMSYWTAYSQIDPASRNAFLQWLAEGCKDPNINIGYVFLYFYGLERRALFDTQTSPFAMGDLKIILDEVKRLRTIYNNSSFSSYSSDFIKIVESKGNKDKLYKYSPSLDNKGYELPYNVKKGLSQLAADCIPLPSDWALAWVKNTPYRLRTPAYRCKEEFNHLFQIRYRDKFGEGFLISNKGPALKGTYRPASSSFGGSFEWFEDGLLDVTAYNGTFKKIFKIAEACTDELDPYSRCLGKRGNDSSPLAKFALLPALLLKDCKDEEFNNLEQWLIKNTSTDNIFLTDIRNIIQNFSSLKLETLNKHDFATLCQLLGKMGVGIEPDVRFGGSLPKSGSVVLFGLSTEAANSPTPEYISTTVIFHLAAMVAEADGKISEKEEKYLKEQLASRFQLSLDEKARLRAHVQWLLGSSPDFSGVKKRVESLDQTQRRILARFLVSVAQADEYLDPVEIKVLTKIYGLLGIDSKELYNDAHLAAMEPVKIEDAETQGMSFAVPQPLRKNDSMGVELDMSKVKIKLVETAAVTAMLSKVFTEEKTQAPIVDKVEIEVVGNYKYFESEYHGFIKELSQKLSWPRQELEAIAANNNLLIDGVLDSINESAFKAFNQPFFEGNDPIEINPNTLKELQL